MSDELPKGWVEAALPEVAALNMGQSPPSNTYNTEGSGLPFFQGKAEFGDLYPTPEKFCSAPTKVAEADDILISVRAPVGPTNLCHERSCIGRGLAAIRPRAEIPTRYLLFYLRSIEAWLATQGTGSTFTAISKSDLEQLRVRLAPLAEQRRIVGKLEKLLGQVDACQQRLAKIPVLLKRFRQAVLAAACSGRLTADWREKETTDGTDDSDRKTSVESAKSVVQSLSGNDTESAEGFVDLPETWQWRKTGKLFTVETGTTPPKKQPANYSLTPSVCPFFKPTDLDAGAQVCEAREWISEQGEEHARLLPAMTVCVTSIGATIGKTGLLRVRGATNQQINSILPTEGIEPKFTFFYCCSPYFQRRIVEESSSTTLPIINKGRFEELEFPLPPLPEQQEIVRRVESLFALADQIEARLSSAQRQVDALTPSLLARAFAGKLVPQDPNNEPATVLLERIRARAPREKPER